MTHGQHDGRQRDEAHVSEAGHDQQELGGGPAVIVEVVHRDHVSSPRRDEEDIQCQDHLSKHTHTHSSYERLTTHTSWMRYYGMDIDSFVTGKCSVGVFLVKHLNLKIVTL